MLSFRLCFGLGAARKRWRLDGVSFGVMQCMSAVKGVGEVWCIYLVVLTFSGGRS